MLDTEKTATVTPITATVECRPITPIQANSNTMIQGTILLFYMVY